MAATRVVERPYRQGKRAIENGNLFAKLIIFDGFGIAMGYYMQTGLQYP